MNERIRFHLDEQVEKLFLGDMQESTLRDRIFCKWEVRSHFSKKDRILSEQP